MKIKVGTSGFSYKEWQGKFYPAKVSPKEMLRYYSQRLATVEINNTFYHMPTVSVLTSWADQVPEDFIFGLKAPQIITHLKRLRHVEDETDYFFRTLSILDRKLGPVLFQFPKSFRLDCQSLEDFLGLIPGQILCAFEFRSPTWLKEEIFDLLGSRGHSLCTPDADDNPAAEIINTAPWGYLRLRRTDYTDADLARWLDSIRVQNWQQAFVYFKHDEAANEPQIALRFRELVNAR